MGALRKHIRALMHFTRNYFNSSAISMYSEGDARDNQRTHGSRRVVETTKSILITDAIVAGPWIFCAFN
jgi:hypothetical protein